MLSVLFNLTQAFLFHSKVLGERQETSNRDPIQDEMSHDSSKRCERKHIGMNSNLWHFVEA